MHLDNNEVHIHTQTPLGLALWNEGRERRLGISFALATLLVAAALSLVRLPVAPEVPPLIDLLVRLVKPEPLDAEKTNENSAEALRPTEIVEPTETVDSTEIDPAAEPITEPGEAAEEVVSEAVPTDETVAESTTPPVDWEVARSEAAEAYLDGLENPPSANPVLAEKRRRLAGQYRPRTIPAPKPIWENVEKDQLGRTVLRSGNCFKVLDDPNVGSRVEFETFGQFMAKCTFQKRLPKELAWVEDIRQRYDYLLDPDGYLEGYDGPDDIAAEDD